MALQNINREMQHLSKYLGNAAGFRNLMKLYSHDVLFSYKDMYDGLKKHYFKFNNKTEKRFVSNNEAMMTGGAGIKAFAGGSAVDILSDYVHEAIDELNKVYTTKKKGGGFIVATYTPGEICHVYAFKKNTQWKNSPFAGTGVNPYNDIGAVRTVALNNVVESNPDYAELFWGKENRHKKLSNNRGKDGGLNRAQYSLGTAVHLGHVKAVSEQLAAATHGAFGQMAEDLSVAVDDPAFEHFQELQEAIQKHTEILGELKLVLNHDRPSFDGNKISSGKVLFETDQFSIIGEGREDNVGKEWENAAGQAVNKARNDIVRILKEFREKHTDLYKRSGSRSIRDKVIEAVAPAKVRKQAKKHALKAMSKEQRIKKDFPAIIGEAINEASQTKGQGLSDPSKQIQANTRSRRGTTESGKPNSLAPLMAMLNAKLPQTVARNMGPPGLENQTGRFASSVKITDVSTTPQGYPSVGYDYQRNPYQVFEMGRGQAPWATPQRDPRKVIDLSIREIAAQFAVGRFYTRRA